METLSKASFNAGITAGVFHDAGERARLCLSLSVTALILSFPANLMPFMRLEFYGQGQDSTILGGVRTLFASGEVFVALVILLASVVIPTVKILALIYLSSRFTRPERITARDLYVHKSVEMLGRWSMLDIFLVAILVAMLKFGGLARAEIKSGAIYFLLVVLITMAVSEILARIGREHENA